MIALGLMFILFVILQILYIFVPRKVYILLYALSLNLIISSSLTAFLVYGYTFLGYILALSFLVYIFVIVKIMGWTIEIDLNH